LSHSIQVKTPGTDDRAQECRHKHNTGRAGGTHISAIPFTRRRLRRAKGQEQGAPRIQRLLHAGIAKHRPSAAHDLCRSPALHYSCAATRHVPHTTPTSVPASQDAWRRVLEHRGGQCPIMRKWRPPSIWGLCAPCAAEGGQLGRSAVNLCHLACCALGGSIDSTPVAMLSTLTPPTPCSPPHALGVSVATLYPVGRGGRPHLPACAGAGCG